METALVCVGFLHFASLMTVFGASFFAAVLARGELAPPLSRLAAPLSGLALASAAAWFVLVAQAMAGGELDAGTLRDVARDTSFGWVWLFRLALLVLLVLVCLRPDRRWRAPALVSGAAVASLGLVGHAAMQEGALGAAHRLNHAVHLLAAAGWIGGLPPFLACLARFRLSPASGGALPAMMRYSFAGHFAVPAVLATGAIDVALTSRALPWPPDTPYRLGVCAISLVFALMAATALFNRYALAPKAARFPAAARALAAGAVVEIGLGLAAVALASAFANLDPQ